MTGDGGGPGARQPPDTDTDGRDEASRRAQIRTSHDAAAIIAAAVRPDNTESIRTRVEGGAVVTRVARETTGGLQATVDDYVVNLTVAETVARTARNIQHDNE